MESFMPSGKHITKDLSGMTFGRWTAIKKVGSKWKCRCSCGVKRLVYTYVLVIGKSRSCGCFNIDKLKERAKNNKFASIHGFFTKDKRLHMIWYHMLDRCENKNDKAYKYYGGRGIKVCRRWHNEGNFFKWSRSHGYKSNLTLERVNNNGNYSPENCTWIPQGKQSSNRNKMGYLES